MTSSIPKLIVVAAAVAKTILKGRLQCVSFFRVTIRKPNGMNSRMLLTQSHAGIRQNTECVSSFSTKRLRRVVDESTENVNDESAHETRYSP